MFAVCHKGGALSLFCLLDVDISGFCILKELCHKVCENSNRGNGHQTEWKTAQHMKKKYK